MRAEEKPEGVVKCISHRGRASAPHGTSNLPTPRKPLTEVIALVFANADARAK